MYEILARLPWVAWVPITAIVCGSVVGLVMFIVKAIHRVEKLANSTDLLVAGPAPESGFRRRAWLSLREGRIAPLERELDLLLLEVSEDPPEELGDEDWLVRLLNCLTACERYFEQRGRLGENKASNRELTLEQWDRILAAAEALDSLTTLNPASDRR